MNYNTLKEKWNFQEIKAMLVQEEGRLKNMKEHSIHYTFHKGASSSKNQQGMKNKQKDQGKYTFPMNVSEGHIKKGVKCFFCRKFGHLRIDCP